MMPESEFLYCICGEVIARVEGAPTWQHVVDGRDDWDHLAEPEEADDDA